MSSTKVFLHAAHTIAPVDERVFGGFLEHLGRAVYDGLVDPDSAALRGWVMDALKPLRMTAMRYPGGNFVSGYHWQDGIGPVENRPTKRELAWQSIEPNLFGTDEFIVACEKMGWTPMMAVNLGTGTPEEARNWLEYCNGPAGTQYADMRVANGHAEPYGVGLWCLGNEMDGPWQLGHVPADQYAIRAQQAAKMMKDMDPSVELVACGSCAVDLPTFMDWDRAVLEHMGEMADYISIHRYVGNPDNDTSKYLAVTNDIDRQIENTDAVCRYVAARKKFKKRAYICFDEWNVWYRERSGDGRGVFAPHLLEEVYNTEDMLVAAGFLMSFIRHADSVKIANIAQIVNVIAPVMTKDDKLFLQTIYWPFEMMSSRRDGTALRVAVEGPGYDTEAYGSAKMIDAASILGDGKLHVFLANRDSDKAQTVEVDVSGLTVKSVVSAEVAGGGKAEDANSFETPDAVNKSDLSGVKVGSGIVSLELPKLSFAAITLEVA